MNIVRRGPSSALGCRGLTACSSSPHPGFLFENFDKQERVDGMTKEEALALLEEHRPDFIAAARATAWAIWHETKQPVTVDAVRKLCPPPAGVDPRVMGAVFNRSDWEAGDFVNSNRGECHKRPIRQFMPRDE